MSATWTAAKKEVSSVSVVARAAHKGPVVIQMIEGISAGVNVACADGSRPAIRVVEAGGGGDGVEFTAVPGVRCTIS